jgi:sulfate adenylyltransferase subunit 1 (EFTu-like GTPase family)
MLVWMAADAMTPGKQYVVKHGTRKVPGFVQTIRYRVDVNSLRLASGRDAGLNEIGRCEIELSRRSRTMRIAAKPRDRLLHRDRPRDAQHGLAPG